MWGERVYLQLKLAILLWVLLFTYAFTRWAGFFFFSPGTIFCKKTQSSLSWREGTQETFNCQYLVHGALLTKQQPLSPQRYFHSSVCPHLPLCCNISPCASKKKKKMVGRELCFAFLEIIRCISLTYSDNKNKYNVLISTQYISLHMSFNVWLNKMNLLNWKINMRQNILMFFGITCYIY